MDIQWKLFHGKRKADLDEYLNYHRNIGIIHNENIALCIPDTFCLTNQNYRFYEQSNPLDVDEAT